MAKNEKPLTVGKLKEFIKDIPDNVFVNVLNEEGIYSANVYLWFENLEKRKFITLTGLEVIRINR